MARSKSRVILCFVRASDLRYQQSTAAHSGSYYSTTVNRRQAVLSDISVSVVAQFAAIESVASYLGMDQTPLSVREAVDIEHGSEAA